MIKMRLFILHRHIIVITSYSIHYTKLYEKITNDVDSLIAKIPVVQGSGAGQITMHPMLAKIFDQAEQISKKSGDSYNFV